MQIVIVDVCYAGYIFDYNYSKVPFLITSTYKENSWMFHDGEKVVTVFASALRCKYDDTYKCPIGNSIINICKNININKCQACINLNMFKDGWTPDFWHELDFPSMGTCMVNGSPCLWK